MPEDKAMTAKERAEAFWRTPPPDRYERRPTDLLVETIRAAEQAAAAKALQAVMDIGSECHARGEAVAGSAIQLAAETVRARAEPEPAKTWPGQDGVEN